MVRSLSPLVAAVLLTASCSGEEAPAPGPLPSGPPRWQYVSAPPGVHAALLHVRTPCRIQIEGEGFHEAGMRTSIDTRDLPAGRTIRLRWEVETDEVPSLHLEAAPEAERDAGHTEGYAIAVSVEIGDRAGRGLATTAWTRPGRGRTLVDAALPPARAEALAFGTEVELAAVAVVDAVARDARLRRRNGRSDVELRRQEPGDRAWTYRLWLRIEEAQWDRTRE